MLGNWNLKRFNEMMYSVNEHGSTKSIQLKCKIRLHGKVHIRNKEICRRRYNLLRYL